MARTTKRIVRHDDELRYNPRPRPRRTGTRKGELAAALREW